MPKNSRKCTVSGSNVFADLGLPNPEETLAKAALAHKIITLLEEQRLNHAQIAELLEVDQPKVSALMRGRLSNFSLQKLIRFLLLLGQDIQISVRARPRTRSQPRIYVR